MAPARMGRLPKSNCWIGNHARHVMRHQKKTIKLGRTAEHRKALLANQVCSLIEHQRIQTTLAKAKAERLRSHGIHRVGRWRTSNRGKSRRRKEGETKRGRAKRKAKRTRSAIRRTSHKRRRTGAGACGRAEAEKAEMVRQKISGAGKIISRGVRNRPEDLLVQRGHPLFDSLSGPFVAFSSPRMYDWLCIS